MDGMTTLDAFASAFGFDAKSDDVWTALGKVTAVSGSTVTVLLGGSDVATECEAYCLAKVGDVVLVVVSNGRPRAIARKGGEYLADMTYTARNYKLIPENTDLNTLTEFGTWYRYNSSSVATLSNCPVEYAFKMFVERTIGSAYLVQTIRTFYGNAAEWRRYTNDGGTTWGEWCKGAPLTTNAATANRFLATPNGEAGQPSYRSIAAADLPTVPATKGGTGETTLNDSANALINALTAATGSLSDDDTYIITENSNATEDKYYRRPVSKLWAYIKSKIDSTYGIGTVKSKYDTASAASATSTEVAALSLEAGTWVVTATVLFYSNATGYRNVKLSTTSADTSVSSYYSVTSPAASGTSTILSRSVIVQPSGTTTYYLNALHNSGSSLTCEAQIKAVRIA